MSTFYCYCQCVVLGCGECSMYYSSSLSKTLFGMNMSLMRNDYSRYTASYRMRITITSIIYTAPKNVKLQEPEG